MRLSYLTTILALCSLSANAQTGADYMKAMKVAGNDIMFDVNAEGKEYKVNWGMDAAWDWDYNVYRGIAHVGVGNFATGRVSFQPVDLVIDNGDGTYSLTERQKKKLKYRCDLIKMTGTTQVNLNCDHEALFCQVDEDGNYPVVDGVKPTDYTGRTNYQGKPEAWYKLIKASAQYVESLGLKVVSVSPFNEPDYVWEQAKNETLAMHNFQAIAQLIKEDPYFKDIRVCGGNTLNCNRAKPWYDFLKNYLDEGNTHQLAGELSTYSEFFSTVTADGKVGTADELHNVGEAIVGANYGMTNGIWWGFDSKARGQFCVDSNEGVRLGYGENGSTWTNAAVYRNDVTGEVHGYLGSSERQASNDSYAFVSTTIDVYFNGYGPTRMYVYDVPGGTGYQKGQINAERLFDITWGEDVAPFEVNGKYMIMNVSSKKMLTMDSGNATSTSRKSTGTTQQWNVYPSYTDGDMSYWFIDNAGNTSMHLNSALDWGQLKTIFTSTANIIVYSNGTNHPMEEQWYVKYAKEGSFYIINRLTNKYLYCSSTTSGSRVTSNTPPAADATASELKKYLWRFLPTDAKTPALSVLTPPAAPTDLYARRRPGSVQLFWTGPATEEAITYTILRAEKPAQEGAEAEYNTIGRNIATTSFVDNTAISGKTYLYKVQAVDVRVNRSEPSAVLEAAPLADRQLLCQLQFDGNLSDLSANSLNASLYGNEKYSNTDLLKQSGTQSLNLDGKSYAMLPYSVADRDEMTIATWVRWNSSGSNWQRIFDFGNGTDQYMFLCPSNGSEMRFVMKNGGDEEILSNGAKLAASSWQHVAVTIKPEGEKVSVKLYLNGEAIAESADFTITPSDIRPSLCYIGRSMFKADPLFNGRLDDFRIYNYALTAEEIASMMTDTGESSADLKDTYEETVSTAIQTVRPSSSASSSIIYNLNGTPSSAATKGIKIVPAEKKKVVR